MKKRYGVIRVEDGVPGFKWKTADRGYSDRVEDARTFTEFEGAQAFASLTRVMFREYVRPIE